MSERARLGEKTDAAAFEHEYEKLRTLGERYVLRRFGGKLNHADAEDAVAEVLIRLHERASRGETPENLRAAFFTSVRNAAIDQLRARGARPTVALEIAEDTPTDGAAPIEYVEGREEGAMLGEALAGMRRNYREAILLRFGVGLSVSEIAERQGISVEGAKKVVLRGTRQVKERLLDVTSASHCEEMQGVAKRHLFEKYAAEVATEKEVAQLEKHMEHCGRCKSLVFNLHHNLHELASGALVSTTVGDQLTDKVGVADHVSGWIASAGDASHAGAAKAREAAYSLAGRTGPEHDAAAGAAGVGGAGFATKAIVTACIGGAAAGGVCVERGIVDLPGASANEPAVEREESPSDTTPAAPAPVGPAPADAVADPTPKPERQLENEVGFESSSKSTGGSSSGGEFGGPSSASAGGGSGGGGGEFGIE